MHRPVGGKHFTKCLFSTIATNWVGQWRGHCVKEMELRFTQNLSSVLSDPGRSRSEVNTFFTRHWGDSFVPPTTIPRSTLIPPISDQQFVTHQKNTGRIYKRYHATKRALAALQQPSTCGEGDADDLPLVLMDPLFHLSDERTFTDIFTVPQKGVPDPLIVTRSGKTAVSCPPEVDSRKEHGSFRDYMSLSSRLESFHDVVDSRLATRLVAKSAAFWQMVHSYGRLHEELADAMGNIRKVRSNLQAVSHLVCDRTRKIIRLYEQREKKHKLLAKLFDVACLREAQTTVQMLLNQSDYPKAIECIETSEDVLSCELNGVQCFRHLGSQLTELYGVIGRMMLEDFASLIQKEFGTKPEEGVLMTYDGELTCVIMGLVQVRRFSFMSMIRTEILEAVKGILRHEVKLHIVQSGLDLTDFDPTLSQLGEPVRRLSFDDWLKTVDDVTKEFFNFCKRVEALQKVVYECAERIRNHSTATKRMKSPFSEDSLQVRATLELSSSDQDLTFGGLSSTTDLMSSSDPAALLAVEIRSLPQLLKSASILAEFAHHCAQTRLCRLLVARSKLQEGVQDLTTPEQMTQMISLVKTYQQDCSVQGWHKTEPIAVSPLSKCLQKLCLEYIERFHSQRRAKMSSMLDAELWKASEVAAEFQCLVDEAIRTNRLRNVPASGLSVGGEALMVENTPYVVVGSSLIFMKILADYCECFAALPTFAADILSRVVELLKGFNSRCCQLILGAGALQLVGLKTISVRNLALASRSLQLIVHFIPMVANEAESSLKEDQKHLMRHFKQALTDYSDHIGEITAKLISVIDHHTINCLNNWEVTSSVPSPSFQQICRQMQKFHNGLAGIFPDEQIKSLFDTVHEHFKGNLKLHLAKIGISPHDSLKYGFVSQDYAFYAQSLKAMSSCNDLYVESLNDVIYGRFLGHTTGFYPAMGTPMGPVKINIGDKIKDQFMVKKKIGEGACGQVYLVNLLDKNGKAKGKAAMKVEPLMKSKDDEILKMEIFVLKKIQNSRHVCRCYASGKTDSFTFVVMSLLGKELSDIRRRLPNRKMSAPSTLRICIQVIRGLQDLHEAGFVHRDVKPSNLAMGLANTQVVYIFDFGLARQILLPDEGGKLRLREARTKVMFRGTVRYCSLNVHQHKEQGRHDDLYGALYSMIECLTASLPWKGMVRKEAAKVKENTGDIALCKGCPPSFLEMAKTLRKLVYKDVPPYKQFMEKLKQDLPPKIKMTDPYEWNKAGGTIADKEGENVKSDRAEADKDAANDKNTVNEIDESVVTEERGSVASMDTDDYAKEDTLEGI
ncbi:hypothetical protein RB195_012682 [Necator americanus]|uniref:Vacuolar protein sorting-associated protein 54 n=1 Tax=Necator americanus TaxID=51031 RepID=A0ABR1DSV5_NECAM